MRIIAQQNELNEKSHLDEYISIANRMEKKVKRYENENEKLNNENDKLKNELRLRICECNNYNKDLKSVINEKQNVFEINSKLESEINQLKQQICIYFIVLSIILL